MFPTCNHHDGAWNIDYDPVTHQHLWTSPTGRTYTNPKPDWPGSVAHP